MDICGISPDDKTVQAVRDCAAVISGIKNCSVIISVFHNNDTEHRVIAYHMAGDPKLSGSTVAADFKEAKEKLGVAYQRTLSQWDSIKELPNEVLFLEFTFPEEMEEYTCNLEAEHHDSDI